MQWIPAGATLLAVGVMTGAFGAHALGNRLPAEALRTWETATLYLFLSALGLVLVGILQRTHHIGVKPGWALLAGAVLFSGSLYAITLGAPRGFAWLTPLGGLSMIAGWGLLAWQTYTR